MLSVPSEAVPFWSTPDRISVPTKPRLTLPGRPGDRTDPADAKAPELGWLVVMTSSSMSAS